MKKKGFTLIELLAVIVILAVLMVIAVPKILDVIESSRQSAAKTSAELYIDAVNKNNALYQIDSSKYQKIEDGEIDISTLDIKVKGEGPTSGTVNIQKGKVISASLCIQGYQVVYDNQKITTTKTDSCVGKLIYKEKLLNGTDPVLSDNLVPVTIEDDGTVKKANLYSNWYSYANKRWANAVILEDATKVYDKGDIIPESNIESYFVWIPKYKYKLFNLGNYNKESGTTKPTTSSAEPIDIVFGTTNTSDSNEGECTTPGVSGATGNCAANKYMTHPAFLAFDTNGLWVGKFETTGSIDNITVKPGETSLRSQTMKSMFEASYNYKRDNESHMMKNTEWGAVAYLSHSEYGINTEININNNSNFFTGYSAVDGKDQSDYPGEHGTTEDITLAYNTPTGYKASTTGNITGVYDMSGGAHEYMASYVDGQYGSSGYTSDPITNYTNGKKYFDKYNSSSTETSYNNRILGDATGEMGRFYSYKDGDGKTRYHSGWYNDFAFFVDSSYPWFYRGGYYDAGVLTSQFAFLRNNGDSLNGVCFRLVLTK